MKLDYINYFLEVIKMKSISGAAKNLYISQQGLSKAIQSIENRFDVILFNRSSSSLSLTAEGKIFAEEAVKIWDNYQQLCKKMAELSATPNSDNGIQVVSTRYLFNNYFPLFNDKLKESKIKVSMNYIEKKPIDILNSLNSLSSDSICAINIPSYNLNEMLAIENIEYVHLFDNMLMVNVASDSPHANKKSFTRQELAQCPIAIYYDDTLLDMLSYLLVGLKKADIIIKTTNKNIINQKILAGEVIGFTDTMLEKYFDKNLFTAIPIQNTVTMHHGFIYLSTNPPSTKIMDIMKFIKKHFTSV